MRSRFGPYEVIGPIGAEGMGEVYRDREPQLSRDVAQADHGEGVWIVDGVFSQRECEILAERVSHTVTGRGRAGIRHLMSNPAVAALASDHRLLEIARKGLGGSVTPFRATLFEKSGRANWLVVWHQDTALPLLSSFESAEWGPWSMKDGIHYSHAPTWALTRVLALRIHIDASTSENGPLRVLPGSHREGVLTDDQVAAMAKTHKTVECPAPQGAVLVMRPLTIHSSSKAKRDLPRRVLHIEYATCLDLGAGIRLAIA